MVHIAHYKYDVHLIFYYMACKFYWWKHIFSIWGRATKHISTYIKYNILTVCDSLSYPVGCDMGDPGTTTDTIAKKNNLRLENVIFLFLSSHKLYLWQNIFLPLSQKFSIQEWKTMCAFTSMWISVVNAHISSFQCCRPHGNHNTK